MAKRTITHNPQTNVTVIKTQHQVKEKKYAFTSLSQTQTITPLLTVEEKKAQETKVKIPKVYYTEDVWNTLWFIVNECQKEVGWLGTVQKMPNDIDYLVNQLYVPEQIVSGAETDIKPEAMVALAEEILNAGKDSSTLYYWGHSHVNMGVGPSGQDETQVEEYLEHLPIFIRGIYNKAGLSKVDIYDVQSKVVYEKVDNIPLRKQLTTEAKKNIRELLKRNVTERVYTGYNPSARYAPLGNYYENFGKKEIEDDLKKVKTLNDFTAEEILKASQYFDLPIVQLDAEDVQDALDWLEIGEQTGKLY